MTNVEETKSISERIDKNDNWEFSQQEIKDFIFDKKNGQQNIKDLVNFLEESKQNRLDPYGKDKYFVDNFQNIMDGLEISEMFTKIDEKINKNENLTNDEKSLIYLDAITVGKRRKNTYDMSSGGIIQREIFLKNSKTPFNPNDPIRKICDGEFLNYIRCCYGNQNYNPEQYSPIPDKGSTIQDNKNYIKDPVKFKQEKEKERIKSEYEGLPQIPPISQRGNEYIHSYCNMIYKRAEDNGYLVMAEYESKMRNEFRSHFSVSELGYVNDKDFDAYVRYDKMLYAFSKYCEVINKKHEEVVKEAGYWDLDEFSQEMKDFSLFQDLIKEKYPELEEVINRLQPYWKEIEENKNKYFGGKSDEEIEKAGKDYLEFQEFQNKKNEEYGITNEMIESLNKIPSTKEETENYFKNLDKILKFQCELNIKRGEYGEDIINNYYEYITNIKNIQGKYNESDFNILKNYSTDLQQRGKSINFDRCNKYAAMIDRKGKYSQLGKDLENVGIISEILSDPTGEYFPIFEVKNAEMEKKLKQESIDKTREDIKKHAPGIYRVSTVVTGFWNGLVDSTIGVGTSLGAMITGLIGGKDHYQSQMQKKERWDNFFKINQTSSQKQAVYDPESGSLNFKRDNTVTTLSSSIAQMLCLIYGGSAVGNGIRKLGTKAGLTISENVVSKAGLTISENVVSKAGLFGMSFITQAGQSYGEAINSGLDGTGAFAYSMLSASIQSGLELVNPNDVLLGKGTGLGKQLISSICKNEGGIKLVGTYFLKTLGREILEENLQEGLQLAAGNLINDMVNGIRNTGLESDWNPKNFLSTAIITTLTTGITTGFSAGRQGINIENSNTQQLLGWIKSDGELYEEVIVLLNNSIEGKFNIPNVTKEQLSLLKGALEQIDATQEQNNDESQNTESENQDNEGNSQQTGETENQENKNGTKKEEKAENKKDKKTSYFNEKSHKYDIENMQEIAIENSKYMDNILENITEENLNNLRKRIGELYKQVTGQELELTNDQLLSILDAHEQDGILGELTTGQLKKKVETLSETIKDKNIRRFLLEFGFCGKLLDRVKGNFTKELGITGKRTVMEQNVDRIVPEGYLKECDLYLYVGNTQILIESTQNGYMVHNLSNKKSYFCEIGKEYTIGREGNILIDQTDVNASRQHVKIKIDSDGNIITKDTSTNGTMYAFAEKQNDNETYNNTNRKEYKIGEEVNIPRSDGRVTKAKIIDYNPENGKYKVCRYENGKGREKHVTQEELDNENNQRKDQRVNENSTKNNQNNIENKKYEIGNTIKMVKNDGTIINAKIVEYNTSNKYYKIEWEENGETKYHYYTQKELDIINKNGENQEKKAAKEEQKNKENKEEYKIGDTIKMVKNDGTIINAKIVEYNTSNKYYKIEWEENGETKYHYYTQKELNNIKYNLKPNRGINTEEKEMSEVERDSDVIAIGDLHGEYMALVGNMVYAGLAREVNGHLEWTGGNKKVVFQGDILADRGTDGLKIIKEIHSLREQAKSQGGDIDIIVGNHDDFMISFLTSRNGIHGNGYNISEYSGQGKGLTELLKYIGIEVTGEDRDFLNLKGRNREILNAMRNSQEGRIILEEICNMKLISQVDDVLYCHTNPTPKMLKYLTEGNVQEKIREINEGYQGYLKHALLGEGKPTINLNKFNEISDTFLDTENRNDKMAGIEKYCKKLKNAGINMISHGHNGGYGYRTIEVEGIKIVDTDHTYMKLGRYDGDGHSISVVKKEGGKNYVGDDAKYANETTETGNQDTQEEYNNNGGYNRNNAEIENQDTDIMKGNENNIDYIKNLGINVIPKYVFEIEELTNEQLENIKNIVEQGVKVNVRDIGKIKNLKLTPEQKNNIFKIQKLEIKFDAGNLEDIINLENDEIENITNIKNLGIDIDSYNISDAKKIKLKPEEINNISKIISYGIIVNILDIEKIKSLTPEENNNIKVIKIDLKINVDAQSIENIKKIKLTENEINNIKKIKDLGIDITVEDINTVKDFDENYTDLNYENNDSSYEYNKSEIETNKNYKCGTIIEEIEKYVQNCIPENRNIGIKEILKSVRPNLISLTPKEKINIIRGTIKIVTKFNTVRQYIDFENGQYKDKYPNAKALLCEINGCYYPDQITEDITVKQYGPGLMFFIGDKESYRIIAKEGLDKGSGGLHFHNSKIKELAGAYSIVNGRDPGTDTEKKENRTIKHEGQHNWNDYFMIDKGINNSLVYAKDEIIAFLSDGSDFKTIEKLLTMSESEGGLYQYGLKGEERENHKAQVKKLLIYANNLLELTNNSKSGITRDRVISMLSNASVNQWEDLHTLITESVQQHIDRSINKTKIERLKERFTMKIKERAGNNKLVNNLIEFWNSMFPNYGIEIEEFRWAGTAKKETVIKNLENCSSIDEIKHILNDPKYSHIGRGTNNLGGIEVSHIIDEFLVGKMSIDNIPTELRQCIKDIYKKSENSGIVQENGQKKIDQKSEESNKPKEKQKKRNQNYFDGQSHEFDVTQDQAIENSQYMDNILESINEGNMVNELNNLRKRISEQHHKATGENIELTDEQLLSILDAHEQDGVLGELTLGQLKQKVKILSVTVTDPKIRRFLLEAGFCGKVQINNKVNISAENFEIPLKNGKCEYTTTETGKPAEEITPQQAKECFFNGLDITSQLMEGQTQWSVLSSGSLFLNNPEFMKLGGDIDVATDVQTFRNVALEKQSNGKTKLDQFKDEGTIRDLVFTRIDHSELTIEGDTAKWIDKKGQERSASIEDLIAKGDIRVEFNIPSKDGFMINCEFFPEPEGYGLIQLGTTRTEGKVNTYTINGREVKTVNEELAAMSYMINLAHEFKNNTFDARKNAIEKGNPIPKLKDSVRINNFLQYLSTIGLETPNDIIEFIDKTKSNYEKQKGAEFTITENGKTNTINVSKYLKDGLDNLGKLREILVKVESEYRTIVKTEGSSWGTETSISFNQFMSDTYNIKQWRFNGIMTYEEATVEIEKLKTKINISNPKNFAYYYEIYQLQNFIKA